jgi:predicted membrane-bound spermidine synthase
MASSSISRLCSKDDVVKESEGKWRYYALFFSSGFPALLYQIVWQRALFTTYGVNIESVTVIVTVFMLGLGLGSLAGGRLSTVPGVRALRTFGLIEFSIGVFGACSLWLFHWAAQFTAGKSIMVTGAVTFVLLLIPTLLMGSTLPLLVAHLVKRTANVGESVGSLYAVNTFGSGVACFFAAMFLMRLLGESGTVRLAASLNLVVGVCAFLISRGKEPTNVVPRKRAGSTADSSQKTIPFGIGILLAAAAGFIALAYEIVWYRVYAFASGGAAPSFSRLLAFYLFGIAYGSLAVHDLSRKKLKNDFLKTLQIASSVVAFGSIAAFLVGPVVSFSVSSLRLPYSVTYVFVAVAAALLGSAFPIIAHATIDPFAEAGRELSFIYLSNIVGSALGSYVIGFVVFDHWSIRAVSVLLLALGFVVAFVLVLLCRPVRITGPVIAMCVGVLLVASSGPLYSRIYERLLFKADYDRAGQFKNLVENRSGVIAVDSGETVYGGGVYDGQFNTDPVQGSNGIFRAYAIAAMHPDPKNVLVIGLSSGSWTQVLANHPAVRDVTVVEINPGYLQLIGQRPIVSSLLRNPKVHIFTDDGRRWLVSHPDRKFDFILMNTTFNWRANATNLLSIEFMQLLRQHLNVGGVAYYNTTSSGDVQFTGASVFPYALRVSNFLAVSDSPIIFDRSHWRDLLTAYRIDNRQVFDLSLAADRAALESMISLPEATREDTKHGLDTSIEDRASLLHRLQGARLITDDNMGTEWAH